MIGFEPQTYGMGNYRTLIKHLMLIKLSFYAFKDKNLIILKFWIDAKVKIMSFAAGKNSAKVSCLKIDFKF